MEQDLELKVWEDDKDWTEIRYRVRNPDDFQANSFRRVPLQKSKPKVVAVMGKLKSGDGKMTIQALRFPKSEGWTLVKAKAWVKQHFKKDMLPEPDEATPDQQEMEFKECRFEIKQLNEDGTFEGLAAFFGNVDQKDDVLHAGAFRKTILERKGKFPVMRSHQVPVGIAVVDEVSEGLLSKGAINLEKQSGRDAYSDMKFYRDHGMQMGMSIGFMSIPERTEWKGEIRHLHEVKLYEVTLTEFPANEKARVLDVKQGTGTTEEKAGFADALARRQIYQKRDQMLTSLYSALEDPLYAGNKSDQDIVSECEASIDEFKAEYMAWLPELLAMRAQRKEAFELELKELKEGRRLSGTSMGHAKRAHGAVESMMGMLEKSMDGKKPMDHDAQAAMMGHCTRAQKSLQALLGDDAASTSDDQKKSSDAASTSSTGAATSSDAPEKLHPLLQEVKIQIDGVLHGKQ